MKLEKRKLKLKRDWVGGIVVLLKEIENYHYTFPKGTKCYVTRNYMGLYLVSEPCPQCGRRFFTVSRVPESDVEYLGHPEGEGWWSDRRLTF